eukprot:TRINITY_DN11682_c0_g1_i1.p1 TRINITY_DN11682_c0_g1~~TRINITY_DN11682_c0_g1_i1.p1  ORF type:complete len:684 (+),score=246.49 TRINITY_DN11682_c0_g1_i1:126-2054(+)
MGKRGKNGGGRKQNRPARAQATTARVLLVVLRDLETPSEGEAKLDNVFWVMSQFGVVEKMSLFTSTKDSKEQVLVQYDTHERAQSAMEYLNNKTIDTVGADGLRWGCTLVIVFSTVPELSFKKENESNKTYDPVNDSIADKELQPHYDFNWGEHHRGDGWLVPPQPEDMKGKIPEPEAALPPGKVGTCIYLSGLPDPPDKENPTITADMLYRIGGQYGSIVAAKVLSHNAKKAILQFQTEEDAEAMRKSFDSFELLGKKITTAKSTLPNASNWSGVLCEKWMYSLHNEEPPQEAAQKVTPSRALLVHNWEVMEPTITALVEEHGMEPPAVFPNHDKAGAVLEFPKREDAFKLCGYCNGREVELPEGGTERARVYFTHPITQSPATCGLGANGNPLSNDIISIDALLTLLPMEQFLSELRLTRYTNQLREEGYDYAQQLVGIDRSSLEDAGVRPTHVDIILTALSQKNDSCSVAKEKRSQTEPTKHWSLQDAFGEQGARSNTCPVGVRPEDEWAGGLFSRATATMMQSRTWMEGSVSAEPKPPAESTSTTRPVGGQPAAPPATFLMEQVEVNDGDDVLNEIPEIDSSRSGSVVGLDDLLDMEGARDIKTLDDAGLCDLLNLGNDSERRSKTLDVSHFIATSDH